MYTDMYRGDIIKLKKDACDKYILFHGFSIQQVILTAASSLG